MKKTLAIILAALMLLTVVPFAAFAKVDKNDQYDKLVPDIIGTSSYKHIKYVNDHNEFKTDRHVMTAFAAYDDAWLSSFTDSKDVGYAETVLLNLIEKVEAEYNNGTYETVLKALEGVKTGMEIVEKIDSYTNVLELSENSSWGTAVQVLGFAVKAGNIANDAYEKYVEAYAKVLSIQAASIYYSEFLDYIINNVSGEHEDTIKTAARNIKAKITQNLDTVKNEILAGLATDIAKEGAYAGISVAMKTNTVTAVIDTIYNLSGTIGKKVFNSNSLYEYMTSLAELVEIEACVPAYVNAAKARQLMPKLNEEAAAEEGVSEEVVEETKAEVDDLAWNFAINALLTLRESGETMLKKLAETKNNSIWEKVGSTIKLWSSADEMNALIKSGAIACAKLKAYRAVLAAPETYTVYNVYTYTEAGKNIKVFDKNGVLVGKIISGTDTNKINDKVGMFASADENWSSYIQVVVAFEDGIYTIDENYKVGSGSGSGSSSSGGSSKGGFSFASLFSNFTGLFSNLGSIFTNLFSFFKF